jgi:hypothetical protein
MNLPFVLDMAGTLEKSTWLWTIKQTSREAIFFLYAPALDPHQQETAYWVFCIQSEIFKQKVLRRITYKKACPSVG